MIKQTHACDTVNQSAKTPFLEVDLNKVREAYVRLRKHLRGIDLYYAMKCNPNPEIMKTILECGGQFEISSADELKRAMAVGANPKNVLFSNPVKTVDDIKFAYDQGLYFFAFDKLMLALIFCVPLSVNLRDANWNIGVEVPTEPLLLMIMLLFLLKLIYQNQ